MSTYLVALGRIDNPERYAEYIEGVEINLNVSDQLILFYFLYAYKLTLDIFIGGIYGFSTTRQNCR